MVSRREKIGKDDVTKINILYRNKTRFDDN